jgi:hypothetical protein
LSYFVFPESILFTPCRVKFFFTRSFLGASTFNSNLLLGTNVLSGQSGPFDSQNELFDANVTDP